MKELTWDLTNFFKNKEEYYELIEELKTKTKKIETQKNINIDENNLILLLNESSEIKEKVNKIWVYGNLVYYKNINDEECINMKKTSDSIYNEINSRLKFIEIMILETGIDKIKEFIKNNKKLEIYELYLDNLFRKESHVQDENTNEKIKANYDSMDNEKNKYNELNKNIEFASLEINGEIIPIDKNNLVKLLSSSDREIRRQAYMNVYNAYKQKNDEFALILNALFKTRINNATLEKYDSVLENILFEENIDSSVIDKLLQSINKYLPLIQKYLDLKITSLNIEDPHLYDLNASIDNSPKLHYTLEEGIEIIKKALEPLGSEYIKNIDILLNGHIDAVLDENKHQTITFSWNDYSFLNYRGSYVDLKNLIHELGHIINYFLSKGNVHFIYEDSTIFVGETASIINEILLTKYLIENAKSKEEKIFYLSKEIENYFTSVFKQVMYTEFENNLYKLAKTKDLTNEILTKEYEKIMRKYYGERFIYDEVSFSEWTRLGHIYRWSYYNYKYATGLLIASNVVSSLTDNKTLSKEKYIEFLSSGSSMYSLDLLKILNIDFKNNEIFDEGFKVLENDIKSLEKILSEKA